MTVPRLRISGVCRSFGSTEVLRGIDLEVAPGEVAAVVGPSGGGKTTLLRLVAGFDLPDAGRIWVDDELLAEPGRGTPAELRRVGIVPQEGALFPHLDVAGNVGFGLRRGPDRDRRVEEMLELVGLAGLGRRRPADLSGGQQQRVALARALAPAPRLLLLDEPFAALDTNLRAHVRDETFGLIRAAGATAVLVTHDRTEAFSVADKVGILLDGRLAQTGTPAEVYEHPATSEVALFTGDGVRLPATTDGTLVHHPLGVLQLDSAPHTGVSLVVRPEHLSLTAVDDATTSTHAEVVGVTFHGHDTMVRVLLDSGHEVMARLPGHRAPRPGDRVGVRLIEAPLLFPDR
ncbi:MAG: hypothetical protein RLZ04_1336 [Actinomycetota bacterium]